MKLYDKVQVSELGNGFTVITDYIPQSRVSAVEIVVLAGGSHCAPNATGAAHFLEHMWTYAHPDMSNRDYHLWLRNMGVKGSTNFQTSYERTTAFTSASTHKARAWMDIVGDMIGRMAFTPDDVEAERGAIVQEMRGIYSSREARFNLEDFNKTFAGQPFALPLGGFAEHLEVMTYADLMAFYHQYYVGANMMLVTSGDFKHEDMVAYAEDKFGHLPKGVRAPNIEAHSSVQDFYFAMPEKVGQQTSLTVRYQAGQFRGASASVQLLAGYLHEQMFDVLRMQHGLAYAPEAGSPLYAHNGMLLAFNFSVHPQVLGQAIELVQGIVRDVPKGLEPRFELIKDRMYQERLEAHVHMHSEPQERSNKISEEYAYFSRVREPYEELELFLNNLTLDKVMHVYDTVLKAQIPSMSYKGDVESVPLMSGVDFARGIGVDVAKQVRALPTLMPLRASRLVIS